MKIHLPSPGTIIYRGHAVQLKWEFRPQMTLVPWVSGNSGRSWSSMHDSGINGEDFTWTVPSDWPSNTIRFKVADYSPTSGIYVTTENFTVQ